ncbi:transglycosylase SLT domain-containing protein, partial [Salmonella enterica subsp. enterica serovar Kentucky]|uniref:transglycosylase SLT domain-containing protein n=1 Tax=Salmonella enterica TaxID=28901 RepID=UPI003F4C045E
MTIPPDTNSATHYDSLIANAEAAYGLPGGLLKLTMMIENRNDPQNRTSPKGAAGVMQIMPANFEYLGITDPMDPEQSINGAAKLYQDLLKQYGGDV